MYKELKSIEPKQCGKMLAILAIIMSAIYLIPKTLYNGIVGVFQTGDPLQLINFNTITQFAMPVVYGVVGFVSGVVFAWVYNRLVKHTGGFYVMFDDDDEQF